MISISKSHSLLLKIENHIRDFDGIYTIRATPRHSHFLFQFRVKLTIICADNGVPSLSTEQVLTINILQIEDPPQIVLTPVFGFADDASGKIQSLINHPVNDMF